jgi:hypothetical protein
MNRSPQPVDARPIGRREAIKRTALILGVAISPSLLRVMLKAQSANVEANGKTTYLGATRAESAGAIAERIIPKTDTPGALDVGVPAFLDLIYGEFMSDKEKEAFTGGLTHVEALSMAAHGTGFAKLPPTAQDALLRDLADDSQNGGGTFFRQIRELTLLGYFTSETVGKKVLHYDPIPGRFDPCVPIRDVGNVCWTD